MAGPAMWLPARVEHTPRALTPAEALAVRMRSLLLHGAGGDGRPAGVHDVVTWFGAMQAQDAASGLWSLGVRLPQLTATGVQAALERREALRTWPMRGTVHLVPSRDARWMVELMGPRILAGTKTRRAGLGITDETAELATAVLGEALVGGGRLTRPQCLQLLTGAGISVQGQRGYHLLGYAAHRAVICIAPDIDRQQSFVLLDEWAPQPHRPERDEALATMALRYFRSHGPTTRQDFVGWTGLTVADARRGITVAQAAGELEAVLVDGHESYVGAAALDDGAAGGPGGAGPARGEPGELLTLPGFDEYLLGYKDRSLMLDAAHLQAVVPGGNGVFQSTLVRDGRVIGTWKRTVVRNRTVVQVLPLITLGARERTRIERAFAPYARFTERPLDVTWP
jgi:hypothetical protein